MTYPADLDTITVRHKITDAGGRVLAGNTVEAVPSARVWATDGSIVEYRTSTQIAADGTWELDLPYVDQDAIRNKGVPWRITEHVPGNPKSYLVAPVLAHGAGPIDAAEALVSAPSSRQTVIQAGPITDETAAGLLDLPGGQFAASLSSTIATETAPIAEQAAVPAARATAADFLASQPGVEAAAAAAVTVEAERADLVKGRDPRPITGTPVQVIDSGARNPYWLSRDRTTVYGGGAPFLTRSIDNGHTWEVVSDSQQFPPWIAGVREMDNGEILVSTGASGGTPGALWVSARFAEDWATATWAKVLDAGAGGVGPSSHFSGNWGMDAHENIALVSEYGRQRPDLGDQARFVYLSTDYGQTWDLIYDIGTAQQAHVHSAFFDPWWRAIWVSQGDQTNNAVKVSFDMGNTWTQVAGTAQGTPQMVGGIALPGCILFGSDAMPDGIYRIDRTLDRQNLSLVLAHAVAGGASDRRRFIGGMPYWTGRRADPVLIPFVADETYTAPAKLIATMDGYAFEEVWQDTQAYQHKGLWKAVGPTLSGAYLGELQDDRGPVRSRLSLSFLPPLRTAASTGHTGESFFKRRPGAGTFTDGDVIEVGAFAHHLPTDTGTSYVQGGASNYENVIGGNPANVSTPNSLLTGAPALTGENGNWSAILHGYDNVNNGWANILAGFHQIAHAGSNHATVCGGASLRVAATSNYGVNVGGLRNEIDGTASTLLGGEENTATANHAVVTGGYRNDATGVQSFVGGGTGNEAAGTVASVLGGANNSAGANYSVVTGGQNNANTGASSAIAAGSTNTNSASTSFIGSGLQNNNTGQYGFIGAGYQNSNAASYGAILAGRENEITAAGSYGTAFGRNAKADFFGAFATSSGSFAANGDAQKIAFQMRNATTGTTPADLFPNGTSNRPVCPANTTWALTGTIVARRVDGGAQESAAWKVEGVITRAGGSPSFIAPAAVTQIAAGGDASNWGLVVAIDGATGGLKVTGTGADGSTVRWVATLDVAVAAG